MNAYTANAKQYTQQYKQQQVLSATPEEVLLMLYDGAIKFLVLAQKGLQEKNLEKSNKNLIKAQKIIQELMITLDMETGGEAAKNLFNLYEYYNYRLVQANIKRDVGIVDEVLGHLRSLKETWEQAVQEYRKDKNAGIPTETDHAVRESA